MLTLAHIVNPVTVSERSDLFVAQPVTFETMRWAREAARPEVEVALLTAQFPEDRAFVPDDFTPTPDLDRSALDLQEFGVRWKLPLARDILDRLYEHAPKADFLIYTNVDIALMPHFYVAVGKIIDQGIDAFVVNRRSISGDYRSIDEIPLMYSAVGDPHLGYDCFVFQRDAYPRFDLAAAFIGVPPIGKVLLANLMCCSRPLRGVQGAASHLPYRRRYAMAIGHIRRLRRTEHGRVSACPGPPRAMLGEAGRSAAARIEPVWSPLHGGPVDRGSHCTSLQG